MLLTFLTLSLQDLLEHLNLSTENVIEVYYFFALDKPKPQKSTPADDWISRIAPLTHLMDTKAKSYAVGFFEGDLKLYDSKHSEVLTVSQLHQASQITDLLYFKSDLNKGTKYLISCSELPNPELTITEVASDKRSVKVVAKAKDEFSDECQCGYTCLAQNPLSKEKFAASSQVIEDNEKGISLWEVNPESETWANADYSVSTVAGKR